MTEETAKKPRGRPFPPKNNANPKGRGKGVRNHRTILLETLARADEVDLVNVGVMLNAAVYDFAVRHKPRSAKDAYLLARLAHVICETIHAFGHLQRARDA